MQPVRGDLSGQDRRADHDWQLRARHVGARLSVGRRRRRSAIASADDARRMGRPGGHRRAGAVRAVDPAFREWWASYLRMGASPGAAVALTRMNAEIDVRDVLPLDPRPHAGPAPDRRSLPAVEEGRYLASRIPGATCRVARRRSPAVCRRSGSDADGGRAVPETVRRAPSVRPSLSSRRC